MEQNIIESDSLVTIRVINGEINLSKLIANVVEDIKMLAKDIRNIKFVCCNRPANMLADMLIKVHFCCT